MAWWRSGGAGSRAGFDDLDAPVLRLGGREVPIPYNEDLERAATPQVGDIVEAVKKVLG